MTDETIGRTELDLEWFKAEQAARQAEYDRRMASARERRDGRLAWFKAISVPAMVILTGVAGYLAVDLHGQNMERRKFDHQAALQREAAELEQAKFRAESKVNQDRASLEFVRQFLAQEDEKKRLALIDFIIAVPVNRAIESWATMQRIDVMKKLGDQAHAERNLRLEASKLVRALVDGGLEVQKLRREVERAPSASREKLEEAISKAEEANERLRSRAQRLLQKWESEPPFDWTDIGIFPTPLGIQIYQHFRADETDWEGEIERTHLRVFPGLQ